MHYLSKPEETGMALVGCMTEQKTIASPALSV
jgi:hypothetical protein